MLRKRLSITSPQRAKSRSCQGSSLQTVLAAKFVEAIPATAKKIAVLDRTKEPGSIGEPLFLDTIAALDEMGRTGLKVSGGRYGLGSRISPRKHFCCLRAS